MQIEQDTSLITLRLYSFVECFLLCFLLCSTGTMGKGAAIQAGKSPMGLTVQISGNQKNKLNDPGGGSFRYNSPHQKAHSTETVVLRSYHVGAAFHLTALYGYRLHSQLHSQLQSALSQLPSWPVDGGSLSVPTTS